MIIGNELVASCIICDKKMISDALAKRYCKLCGMIIDVNEKTFCCNSCKSKFKEVLGKA